MEQSLFDQDIKVTKNKKKILIVDDHPIVRKGLAYFINQQKDLVICGEAENAIQAIKVIKDIQPDMAIIDISLPGQNGIELIKNIKLQYPKLPILALSIHTEYIYAELVLRAGGMGYLMKQEGEEKILTAIRCILKGEIYVSSSIASKIINKMSRRGDKTNNSPSEILSNRELEIFRLIGQGYATRQIADSLSLGIKTVDTYRAHIKNKLNLKSTSELVQYAIKWVHCEDYY